MTELNLLMDSGTDLVKSHDEFPQTGGSVPPVEDLAGHVRTIDVPGATVDVERLTAAIEETKRLFDPGRRQQRTAMDSNLAPIVHQAIDIPPRVAAQLGVWQYLTLMEYPDFITTRWSHDDDLQEKFLGDQKDLYSNHLARLWWGAHLTYDRDNDHYYATHRLFNKQRLVNYVLDSSFRRYRPAAIAFSMELWDETGQNITEIARRFNDSLSTYQLESRSEDDLRSHLQKIRAFVTED
jgi:hypothetical protein